MLRARVIGCGSYLPARVVSNAELARRLDTTDDWIVSRTGIRERRIAADGELTSDLARAASADALRAAGIAASAVDLFVLATSTPDNTFHATATRVQAALGMTNGVAFDVQAVCSGFVFALAIADAFVRTGQAKNVLVAGAETFSRILDWQDRATCVLFGDGAGAVVLRAEEERGDPKTDRGVLSVRIHSDGRFHDMLYVDGGVSSTQTAGHLRMVGREVFKHAVVNLSAVLDEAIEAAGLTLGDIDWLVPHQANKRILDATAERAQLPPEKMVVTVDRHANTSAASIPLALTEAVGDGRIKPQDVVVVEAMGGGFSWGAGVIRW